MPSYRDQLDEDLVGLGYPRSLGSFSDRMYQYCLDFYTSNFGAPSEPLSITDLIVTNNAVSSNFTVKGLLYS